MKDYGKLIPELRNGDGGDWIDVENWLYNEGSYTQLIACGAIFWPAFVEYRGCILRASACNDYVGNYDRLTSGGHVERGYVEERLNRLEIADIITASETNLLSLEQALHIGRLLEQMWKAKLAIDFPDREFHFSFVVYEDDKVEDLEVTFCQSSSHMIGE